MAELEQEQEQKQAIGLKIIPTEGGFPPLSVPTIFADGIANIAPSVNVVKFYLFRTDPDMAGAPAYKNQIYCQIAMPVEGFLSACVFFEKALKHLVEMKTTTQQHVDELRASMSTDVNR